LFLLVVQDFCHVYLHGCLPEFVFEFLFCRQELRMDFSNFPYGSREFELKLLLI
jgi:hypothetical protein